MALVAHQRSDGLNTEPNVLPLIDVLLVLVIIGIVSLGWLHWIPAQVPPDGGAGQGGPTNRIVLDLRADGSYAINHQVVAADQLVTQLHLIYDQRPDKLLYIHADPDRLSDDVVHAMDLARGAGVEVLSLMTGEEGGGR